jgi:3-oxoisoapionate decarboxylase
MQLGLSTYTYGWAVGVPDKRPPSPLDEHGLIDRVLAHDLRLLQIGDNLPLHTFDSDRLDRLAHRARAEGVRLEIGARRLVPERIAAYAGIARRLGATLIRFIVDDTDHHPAPAEVVALLRDHLSLLDGLMLGIENHDRFPAAILRDIVEDVGSERVGICLDTANSIGAGEGIDAVADILAPVTVNLHVKDITIRRLPHLMGFTVQGCAAGTGIIPVARVLQKLAPYPACRTAIVELWPPPEPELAATLAKESAWATQSIDYLRAFFSSR